MPEKVLQCGYMSGDTYTAAAFLTLEPGSSLLLIKDSKEAQDKTGTIEKIYRECGVIGQVKTLDLSGSTLKVKELWGAIREKYKTRGAKPADSWKDVRARTRTDDQAGWLARIYFDENPKNAWPRSITAVTGLVAEKFRQDRDAAAQNVAKAWKVGKLDSEMKFALYEYMAGKFAKTNYDIRKNIVVLWSRQSAKHGGAHLEMDSSYAGIRQMTRYFSDKATVLLTGDERNLKLADIAAQYPQVIDVSAMWEGTSQYWQDDGADEKTWGQKFAGNTYLAQFAFFKYLATDYNVIHVGMRSGMLESMALLGMKTFYMEPAGSASGDRMLVFSGANIPYTRIQISAMPGLTARGAQMAMKDGVAVPTKRIMGDKVRGITNQLMADQAFLGQFGWWHRSKRQYMPSASARQAAGQLAKVRAAGDDFDISTVTPDNLDTGVGSYRGFLSTDLDKIVKAIVAAFKS